ncbi:MAG: hypothetical protein WCJ35_19690 [Planctomycetota bacterium]
MRFWTMVLSLAMAGVIATSAFAQDGKPDKGHGHKKGDRPRMSFTDMDANHDGNLTKDEFVAARMKGVPEDRKEKAKEYIGKMWDTLAGKAESLKEKEYNDAREKMRKEWKDKGGKHHGEKKDEKKAE